MPQEALRGKDRNVKARHGKIAHMELLYRVSRKEEVIILISFANMYILSGDACLQNSIYIIEALLCDDMIQQYTGPSAAPDNIYEGLPKDEYMDSIKIDRGLPEPCIFLPY